MRKYGAFIIILVMLVFAITVAWWQQRQLKGSMAYVRAEYTDTFEAKQPFYTKALGLEVAKMTLKDNLLELTLRYDSDVSPFLFAVIRDYLDEGYCFYVESQALSNLAINSKDILARYYGSSTSRFVPAMKIVNHSDESLTLEFLQDIECKVVDTYNKKTKARHELLIIEEADIYYESIPAKSKAHMVAVRFSGNSMAHSNDYVLDVGSLTDEIESEAAVLLIPTLHLEFTLEHEEYYSDYKYHDIWFVIPVRQYINSGSNHSAK